MPSFSCDLCKVKHGDHVIERFGSDIVFRGNHFSIEKRKING